MGVSRTGQIIGASIGLAAFILASNATAQAPRSTVDMQASSGVPQFRDPKTGQIWTPLNVGRKSGPPTPADLAFDPRGQAVMVKGVVTQRPKIVPLSSVAITAGPTVPIVNLGDATLGAIPGKRWQVVAYLDNNSASTVRATDRLPVHQRWQAGRGDSCAGPPGRRRLARRPGHLRSQDRPVRRSRHLRGQVALTVRQPSTE